MSELRVITNHVPRDVIEAHELSPAERAQFDYINWDKIEAGEDSASFIRYKGDLMDLHEFERFSVLPDGPWAGQNWDGVQPDTFFSGTLIRYVDERVIVGRYYC